MAKIGRLSAKDAVLFLCDMQEKFRPNIFHFSDIVSNSARLLEACRVLGIPPILTEQYPKGLGPTVPELGTGELKAHPKTSFTMITPEVEKELQALGNPKQAILCGIEAHACIACTAFDLLDKGIDVHIVADAISSRSQLDRLFALSRLKQSGAFLTTTEAVMLQLIQDAKDPRFKEIQKLMSQPSPDTGLLAFFSTL
ncbi:isochorismatase domain-containing protein 2 [Mastacembelus armatus]|uniref:Isochorismatase domain containing 2 n=1 Tax=Mastacembelus armatus TaxID=205130 RepID=A0A3Q3NB76_9TELE|nr:isochorismatase domain-containing protein 2 [Mastacembelus armatus]XP_026173549.1 isochorismatase domain-containing protein 2 [Mastacembelus armatus]